MILKRLIISICLIIIMVACSKPTDEKKNHSRQQLENLTLKINRDFIQLRLTVVNLAQLIRKTYLNKDSILPTIDKTKYKLTDDGMFYKYVNDGSAALWISGYIPISESIKKIAYFTEALDPEFKKIYDKFPEVVQVYYNDKNSLNRIYPLFNPLTQYQPKMNIPKFNFYYLADKQHNPNKKGVWVNEPYVDPAGRGWMISVIAPVYVNDELVGVPGLDVTINIITDRYIRKNSQNIMLVDNKGVVITAQDEMMKLFSMIPLSEHKYMSAIKEDTFRKNDYSLLKSRSKAIRKMAFEHLKEGKQESFLYINDTKYIVLSKKIEELDWTILMLVL